MPDGGELEAAVSFCTVTGDEMLRIERGGFYVRGVKVAQDADEAAAVHRAFMAWIEKTGIMHRH